MVRVEVLGKIKEQPLKATVLDLPIHAGRSRASELGHHGIPS